MFDDRIMSLSQDINVLIPNTCVCYLTRQRDFAKEVNLRTLPWVYSDMVYPGRLNVITNVFIRGRQEYQNETRGSNNESRGQKERVKLP